MKNVKTLPIRFNPNDIAFNIEELFLFVNELCRALRAELLTVPLHYSHYLNLNNSAV